MLGFHQAQPGPSANPESAGSGRRSRFTGVGPARWQERNGSMQHVQPPPSRRHSGGPEFDHAGHRGADAPKGCDGKAPDGQPDQVPRALAMPLQLAAAKPACQSLMTLPLSGALPMGALSRVPGTLVTW